MPSLPTVGGDIGTWGTELNEWLAKGGQVFDVKAGYDAVGDGVADDTAEIQAAIDAAAVDGGVVLFPLGKYKVTTLTLKKFVRLVGVVSQGLTTTDGSIIVGTTGSNILTLEAGTDNHNTIEHLQLQGGKNQIVSDSPQTTYVSIDHVNFYAPTEAAIRVLSGAVEEWWISNVRGQSGQYFFKKDNLANGGFNYMDKVHFLDVIAAGQSINNYRIEASLSGTVVWTNCILNTAAQHALYADGGIYSWTFTNVNTEGAGNSGKMNQTTGSITSGTATLTVASGTGYVNGDPVVVAGAGTNGADLQTTLSSGGGTTTLTLAANASTTVTNAKVTNASYDDFAFNNTIATPLNITFVGGRIAGTGGTAKLRYAIDASKLGGTLTCVGLDSADANVPVYDPNEITTILGGSIGVRQLAPPHLNTLRRTTFAPADTTAEAGRTQVVSPPGKHVILGLRDSNDDTTGTFGEFQVRQLDPNRTAIFAVRKNGDVLSRRYLAGQGSNTNLTTGSFTLSAGWGSTASVAVVSSPNDQRGRFIVTSAGTGQGANPTITLTFANGAWPVVPTALITRNGGSQLTIPFDWTTSTTQIVITWRGTPVAAETYTFEFVVMG